MLFFPHFDPPFPQKLWLVAPQKKFWSSPASPGWSKLYFTDLRGNHSLVWSCGLEKRCWPLGSPPWGSGSRKPVDHTAQSPTKHRRLQQKQKYSLVDEISVLFTTTLHFQAIPMSCHQPKKCLTDILAIPTVLGRSSSLHCGATKRQTSNE